MHGQRNYIALKWTRFVFTYVFSYVHRDPVDVPGPEKKRKKLQRSFFSRCFCRITKTNQPWKFTLRITFLVEFYETHGCHGNAIQCFWSRSVRYRRSPRETAFDGKCQHKNMFPYCLEIVIDGTQRARIVSQCYAKSPYNVVSYWWCFACNRCFNNTFVVGDD